MELQELTKLGFNKNEAKVYLALVGFGKATANTIIKHIKFHKNIVYDNLEKLIDKGLVTYVIEEGIRHFKIAPPDMLIQIFDEEAKAIELKRAKAKNIAGQISKAMKVIKPKQEATIYRGIKGIRSFYNQLVQRGQDYVAFGAPQESVKIMGDTFWMNLSQKVKDNKMKMRLIFNESIREHGEKTRKSVPKTVQVRYFKKDFEPLTETNIQGNRVAIIVWTEEPLLFLIEDRFVAENYQIFFEDMWKQARK